MPRSDALVACALMLALPSLAGCDLALAGMALPGVVPGIGVPIQGTVLDSRTRLPIGGATVTAGFGSTVTDSSGRFSLYGSLGAKDLSASRAGYVGLTQDLNHALDPYSSVELDLDPLFPSDPVLPSGFLDLKGQLTENNVPVAAGVVMLGGTPAAVTNGAYELKLEIKDAPGKIYSGVLAGGRVNGNFLASSSPQAFNFISFGYLLTNFPLGDTYPNGLNTNGRFDVNANPVQFKNVQVNYTNLSGFTQVETDIGLDFGLAGTVPVARQLASNQAIPVPYVAGMKYDVDGTARDANGNPSTVSITTNDLSQTAFALLSIPQIVSPAPGATSVGPRPTFSWQPANVNGVSYVVTLFEGTGDASTQTKKWIGRTTATSIQYPGFSPADVNQGALRTDMKYTWNLSVVDNLGATQQPNALPFQPYRARQREAEANGNKFTP